MLAPLVRGRSAVRAAPWPAPCLTLCARPAVAAVIALASSSASDGQLFLPLLAVPPALAGIGAATPRRPPLFRAVMLKTAIAAAAFTTTAAQAAQRAVLRPLPRQVGPLDLGVVYRAAAAEARPRGDLYPPPRTQFTS